MTCLATVQEGSVSVTTHRTTDRTTSTNYYILVTYTPLSNLKKNCRNFGEMVGPRKQTSRIKRVVTCSAFPAGIALRA